MTEEITADAVHQAIQRAADEQGFECNNVRVTLIDGGGVMSDEILVEFTDQGINAGFCLPMPPEHTVDEFAREAVHNAATRARIGT